MNEKQFWALFWLSVAPLSLWLALQRFNKDWNYGLGTPEVLSVTGGYLMLRARR